MLTKKEATKLRKLIRDHVFYASQAEVALSLPSQTDTINWHVEDVKARKALRAYIKSIEEPPIDWAPALIAINQAISDPNT